VAEPLPWPVPRRRTRWSDPAAEHEIQLTVSTKSSVLYTIGCRCCDVRARQPWDAPIEDMWAAYEALPHRPALEATA
jgi:hypothetical protein